MENLGTPSHSLLRNAIIFSALLALIFCLTRGPLRYSIIVSLSAISTITLNLELSFVVQNVFLILYYTLLLFLAKNLDGLPPPFFVHVIICTSLGLYSWDRNR